MSRKVTGNQKHLTMEDRTYIEEALKRNMNFVDIAKYLKKDPTTISREVRKHRIMQKPNSFNNSAQNQCANIKTCQKRNVCNVGKNCRYPCRQCRNCNTVCPDFVQVTCPTTVKAPFVCNGCEKKSPCRLQKWYYRADPSQRAYRELLVSAREGINMDDASFRELDSLITPLVKRGQSIAHICAAHKDDIQVTERTVYNYFDKQLFTAINLDLPRKVRYKPRKRHLNTEPRDYAVREGRTYEDFQRVMSEYPSVSVVEMDTVEGRKGGKVLLTFLVRNCRLQLAFLMDNQTQACVRAQFEWLHEALGTELFSLVFSIILTDNGSEFLDPRALETTSLDVRSSRVFFCDPNCSYQKGMLEKNHEFIRYVLPKGTSFDNLTQQDVNLLVNHVNAAFRDSLSGKSPFDMAEFLLPPRFLTALDLRRIAPDEVLLKPQLLFH